VAKNCKGPSARKAALAELLPTLKFGHMTGDFLLSISTLPDMTRPSAAELIREALRFKMSKSAQKPGSFELRDVKKRNGPARSSRVFSFEGVPESKLVQLAEQEFATVPPIFIDGYSFILELHRQSEGVYKVGKFVKNWIEPGSAADKVSLTTHLWVGPGLHTPLWTQTWEYCAMGRGYTRKFKLLAADGESIQSQFLVGGKLVIKILVDWHI
jgi:hypothetical protein